MDAVALLRLLQLFDSQFPVGAFAHSGGLETYAADGAALPQLREVLENQIELGWGRSELAAACLAWRAGVDTTSLGALHDLSTRVDAFKVIPAARDTSVRLGHRTLTLVRRLYPDAVSGLDVQPTHHAVVIGAVGRRLDLELTPLLIAFAQSLAAGTLAAATRCMPVSPVQAQALLVGIHDALASAIARVQRDPEDHLFTCTPALDIRAHQQAFLHTRLFQS
jgi:urease accessory protein